MNMKVTIAAALTSLLMLPALANDYKQFPAPYPSPFPRSHRTHRLVVIPPYRYPFVVRTYATPPQQPFYNVPPYSVVAPY